MIRISNIRTVTFSGALLVCASIAAVLVANGNLATLAEGGEKKVKIESLPGPLQEAILKAAGQGKIDDIAEITKDGETIYEFDVIEDGKETEIQLRADGSLIHRKDEGVKEGERSHKLAKDRKAGEFTNAFGLEKCTFSATGKNNFFVLEPGYQLTLEHKDGDVSEQLVITVLKETEKVGDVETRVVEERESENGEIKEVSRNYFAFCNESSSIFYFGEETTKYKDGKPGVAEDSWRADSAECRPGLAMPGLVLLGARYQQEYDPKHAMDRAEIVGLDETLHTPAGVFEHCLKVEETNPLEAGEREYKIYAPAVGLIQDEDLLLTKYGKVAQ